MRDGESTGSRGVHGGGRLLLGVIALGWFVTLGFRFLFPAILPQVKDAFVLGNATAGFAITVVWVGYAAMQFPAGVLVDRLGERALLGASLGLAGVSIGVVAAAPTFEIFLVACGSFGLATGLFGTTRGIALSGFFQPTPGQAFGITLAAGSLGSAAVPFVGTVLTGRVGWRTTLAVSVPVFLLTAAATRLVVPAGSSAGTERDELSLGTVASTLRMALTDRSVVLGVAGMTVLLFTFQALTAFLPTYLIQEKALSQEVAGGLFGLFFVTGAGFQVVGGRVRDRLGTRPVILGITATWVVTLAALPLVRGALPVAVLVVLMSSRMASAPVLNPFVIETLPDAATGTAWGLLRTGFFLVSATGSTYIGLLADAGLFDEAFYSLAGLSLIAVVAFVSLPGPEDREGRS